MRTLPTSEPQTPTAGQPTSSQSTGFFGVAAFAMGACWLYGRFRSDPEVREMRRMATLFEAKGAAVRLDAAGSLRPPKLGGHIPDVYAVFRDGTEVALEYENDRSVLRAQ